MSDDIKSHKAHYLALLIILGIGFGSFLFFSFDRPTQILMAILTSTSYGVWGVAHHYSEHNLNWKIVVEYSLFSIISLVILTSLVLRT